LTTIGQRLRNTDLGITNTFIYDATGEEEPGQGEIRSQCLCHMQIGGWQWLDFVAKASQMTNGDS